MFFSHQTTLRESEIASFVAQIEKITMELEEEEAEFITTEKTLIEEICKYEVCFVFHLRSVWDEYVGRREQRIICLSS